MLTVHADYLTRESLASYYVDTPDPLLNCPPFGQRLVITWSVPRTVLKQQNPHLELTLRKRNREEIVKWIPLTKQRGTTLYCLLNDEYCESGGIITYKVQLIADECVIEEWRHQLWADLIQIDQEEDEELIKDLD